MQCNHAMKCDRLPLNWIGATPLRYAITDDSGLLQAAERLLSEPRW